MSVLTPVLTDQQIIQATIDAESSYFANGEYSKWAACLLQTPLTYYVQTPFFGSGDEKLEAFGWEEISQKVKQQMNHSSQTTSTRRDKSHFQIAVIENMAFVRFLFDGIKAGSCVLEKNEGRWLILRMNA